MAREVGIQRRLQPPGDERIDAEHRQRAAALERQRGLEDGARDGDVGARGDRQIQRLIEAAAAAVDHEVGRSGQRARRAPELIDRARIDEVDAGGQRDAERDRADRDREPQRPVAQLRAQDSEGDAHAARASAERKRQELATVELVGPVGGGRGGARVRDQDAGAAVRADLGLQEREHLGRGARIEVAGRLVRQ